MMTGIREIACEKILTHSIGDTYNTFGYVDSWMLACE